jgi:ankyrin repeat protein
MDRELIGHFIDSTIQDPPMAKAMLAKHPELLNARWTWGGTVLHFLAIEGLIAGVRFLLAEGADVNAANNYGTPPLVDVSMVGHYELAALLLQHGADPNAESPTLGAALHAAIHSKNFQLVELLLSAGARVRPDTAEALPREEAPRRRLLTIFKAHGAELSAG